jgi:hypothetical protein
MKKQICNISLLLTVAVLFLTSCKQELDIAPIAMYDGKANHTIAQLLEYHTNPAGFTYDTLPAGIVIEGVVISCDKEGNCYKYITIDDGTAGVQIKINSTNLYHNYPVGQHIFVKCDGLVLGDYGLLPQLGWWENDGMVGINTNVLYKYIFKDGAPRQAPEPIEITSTSQIQDNMYNRLVRIKNCHFKTPGQRFAENTSSGTSNDIVLDGGGEIVLYTSRYADFASQLTPEGTFDMVAILSRFRTTNQLTLRFLSDISTPFIPTVPTEVVVSSLDLSQNPLENGWTNQTISGSSWEYLSGNAMKIAGVAGSNDSWLISPAINASNYDNLSLSFTHRSLYGTANRQVYYSTSYTGGEINEAEWHSLNVNNFATTFTTYNAILTGELLAATNLRFAFRYYDNTTSTWLLSDFKVSTIVEQ